MIIHEFWLTILLIMVMTEIYLLSRYISNRNGVFLDNGYASIINGALVYIVITFITFLPFIWININILYLIIIFWIKEGVTFLFLITRDQKYMDINFFKTFMFVIFCGLLITLLWNYGLTQLIKPIKEKMPSDFATIYAYNNILEKITKVNISNVENWGTTFIVSSIGAASVLSIIREYSLFMNIWKKILGFVLTITSIILFSYKLPLWQNAEIFIGLFIVLVCSRVIQYSRRRYGFVFAICAIASFSFGNHLRLALWGIAIVAMVIYIFMKKSQNSLFWVMLIAPLLMIEALNIYKISGILSLILVIFSIIMFTFMLSLQGVKPLKKINEFFEKYRIITPIVIGVPILILAIAVINVNDINWKSLSTINSPLIYSIKFNEINMWINFVIYLIIFIALSAYIIFKIIKSSTFNRIDFVYIISWLLLIILYNPVIDAMFSISLFSKNIKYVSSVIFLPLSILTALKGINLINKK